MSMTDISFGGPYTGTICLTFDFDTIAVWMHTTQEPSTRVSYRGASSAVGSRSPSRRSPRASRYSTGRSKTSGQES